MFGQTIQDVMLRLDGFANSITGLGTPGLDKTLSARFQRGERRQDQYFSDLYEEDPFARKICEKMPEEMLRAGFDLSMGAEDGALDVATDILEELKRLQANDRIMSGLVWERVHGGSAVLIGVDDGVEDPAKPLDEDNLKRITHLAVIDKPRIWAKSWYGSMHPKAGRPEIYSVQPLDGGQGGGGGALVDVHETRLLIFPGGRVTHERRIELQGWGTGVLASMHDILRGYNMSWQAIEHMMQSVNQDVWKMSGLKQALTQGTEDAKAYFRARFQMGQMKMGPNRAITLDTDESFERIGSTFSGVPETMQAMALRVAATAGMPATVLFGMSPAGMNATGQSDIQLWHSSVAAERRDKLMPQYERIIDLLMKSSEGPTNGEVIEGWGLTFRSLMELSEPERVTMRKTQAETDSIYIGDGVLLPEEVAKSRWRPEGPSTETKIDFEAREDILAAEREERLEAEAAAKIALENPGPEGEGSGHEGDDEENTDHEDG